MLNSRDKHSACLYDYLWLGRSMCWCSWSALGDILLYFSLCRLIFCHDCLCYCSIGRFGSIEGSFVAGILIGIIEALGGFFIGPAVKYAIVFIVYMIVIVLRPGTGLFGW